MATKLATYSRAATVQPRTVSRKPPSYFVGNDFYLLPDGGDIPFRGDPEPWSPARIHKSMVPWYAREATKKKLFKDMLRPRFYLRAPLAANIGTDLLIDGIANIYYANTVKPVGTSPLASRVPNGADVCRAGVANFLVNRLCQNPGPFTDGAPAGPGTVTTYNLTHSPFVIGGIDAYRWFLSGGKWYYNYNTIWKLSGAPGLAYATALYGKTQSKINSDGAGVFEEPNHLPHPRVSELPDPTGWPTRLPRALRHAVHRAQESVGIREAGNNPPPGPRQPDPPPGGNPGVDPPLPPHVRKPPGRREKERKAKTNFPVWFARIINTVTETDDWMDAAIDAMPKEIRCSFRGWNGMRHTAAKMEFVYKHWMDVDVLEFLKNAAYMQLEDYLIGKGSKAEQNAMQEIFERWGLNISYMTSTKTGKASKIAMNYFPPPPNDCEKQ